MGPLSPIEVDQYTAEFEAFHARFTGFFARSEPHEAARQYPRGLLSPVQHKNCWQMAELCEMNCRRLSWSASGRQTGSAFVGETGFLKKGTKSVGVKRQYCGAAGKIENCQVGVFLTYCTLRGYTFLDRRLYLPQEWCQDEKRRREARVPDEVTFQAKMHLNE